jgi:hypothetical protein
MSSGRVRRGVLEDIAERMLNATTLKERVSTVVRRYDLFRPGCVRIDG